MQRNRLAVNFYFLVNGFIYANWVARLPKLQEVYGMDNGTTGLVLLTYAIGALVAMPFTGWLIVKNGSERTTVIASFLFCAMVPFFAVMNSIVFLAALLFITGMFTGVMDVAMNAQAVLVEEAYKRPIMSSFHAVFSGGMMIGAGVGSIFTKWETPLFQHFLIIAIIAVLFATWSSFNLLKDAPTTNNTTEEGGFQLPSRALWGMGVIAFCCMLGEGAMADWSTIYMQNIAMADPALAPIGLGAFSGAMMVGRIFGDKGRAVLGDGKLMIINSLVALSGVVLLILFPIPIMVILGLFLVGLGLSVIVPIAYSTAGSAEGLAPGVGISMVTTIGYSGFLFGPPIIGFIADWQTLRIAMFFVALLFLIMTGLTLWNNKGQVKTV
ncbi:MAG: MFS transporter [Saprospiraceae bacterium]